MPSAQDTFGIPCASMGFDWDWGLVSLARASTEQNIGFSIFLYELKMLNRMFTCLFSIGNMSPLED